MCVFLFEEINDDDDDDDYLTIMPPKLRSTYDGRLVYETSHDERKVFLGYDSLAES